MTHKGLAPILIILILTGAIAVAGGGYYLGTKRSETLLAPFAAPSQTPQPTSSTDETADWKTYTSRFDFEFKYPGKLGDLEDHEGQKVYIRSSSLEESSDCNKGKAIEMNVINNPKQLSVTEFLNEYYKDFNSQAGYQYPVNKYLKDKPNLNTNMEWLINRDPPLCPGKDIFISNRNKIIKLFCANCSDHLIDNILYSFRSLK